MGKAVLRQAVIAAFCVAAAATAAAETDAEFDRRITAELRAQDAAAADLFERANAARDRGDRTAAIALYEQVRAKRPAFTHATRRLCREMLYEGRVTDGKALCREAAATDPSALNQAAFAQSLVWATGAMAPPEADRQLAAKICASLITQASTDVEVQSACTSVAFATNSMATAIAGATTLERLAPEDPAALYFAAIAHAVQGEFLRADLDLWRARQRGLPESDYSRMRRSFHDAWPIWLTAAAWSTFGVIGWLILAAALLSAGIVLSRATLVESERIASTPRQADGGAAGQTFWLRRVYAAVIGLAGMSYYVSLPLVMVVVLLVGGGVLYGMLRVGHIPLNWFAMLLLLILATCWSILKSLVIVSRDTDPGIKADLAEHPRLNAVLKDVAAAIGTRPIDSVYLMPGTEFAVMERGRVVERVRGRAERCLLLGVGVLEGFQVRPFRAVLAHEYGHFVNRDTAGGRISLAVRRSIFRMAASLARAGAATPLNPAWLFLVAFGNLFQRISQGASRLQEVMADRWAVGAYGSEAFCDGLHHVIERSVRFDARIGAALGEIRSQDVKPPNLYAFVPAQQPAEAEVAAAVEQALERPPSPYDSHPAPAQRFEWASRLGGPGLMAAAEAGDAWGLLADRAAIEASMTEFVFSKA